MGGLLDASDMHGFLISKNMYHMMNNLLVGHHQVGDESGDEGDLNEVLDQFFYRKFYLNWPSQKFSAR